MGASLIEPIERVGAWLRGDVRAALDCVGFLGECCRSAIAYNRAAFRFSRRTVANQLRFTVTDAVPLLTGLAFIAGLALIAQSQGFALRFGLANTIADILATILVRDFGPLLAAIAVIARSATAMSTEMANSQILGEFDAMEAAGVDPIQVFVLPRIIACVLGVTILTVLFDAVALLGGLAATWWLGRVHPDAYLASLRLALGQTSFELVLLKAALCGAFIAFVSCWAGTRSGTTSADLPKSVTRGTVLSLFGVVLISSAFAILVIPKSAWLSR